MVYIPNLLTQDEIDVLRSLPEVETAREKLDKYSNVYFRAELPDSIRQSVCDRLGVTLSGPAPFRWIRGDTLDHADRGLQRFENTHLAYLTDGEGQFEIEDASYPIHAGDGFVFSEGVHHSVINTNGTSRLLLGPMSETGMMVGGGISGDGATDSVYLRQGESFVEYKINDGDWNQVFWPFYIYNTNEDPGNNLLKVIFTTGITIQGPSEAFECQTGGIQFGDTSLNSDGTRPVITVQDVDGYFGLIRNGSDYSNGYNDIYVYNLKVVAAGTTTLGDGAGWIGQQYYGKNATNNFIMNCVAEGDIFTNGGGIVGAYAACVVEGGTADLNIIGCYSTGDIDSCAGGIVGLYAATGGGTVTITKCSSSGAIGTSGGGIVGQYGGQGAGATCIVEKSYSTGFIGQNAGGIFGESAGDSGGQASASTCYSRGNISTDAGGIFGRYAGDGGNAAAFYCYSTGDISATGGGIVGASYDNAQVTSCYTSGPSAMGYGFIFAGSSDTTGSYSEAANDTSGWTTSHATTVIGAAGPGATSTPYIEVGTNQPYEFRDFGPSPYSLITIGEDDLTLTASKTVAAGETSPAGVIPGYTYSLLGINGEDPTNTPSITINSSTGGVIVASSTTLGEYTLIVRASGSPYVTTTLVLTVTGAVAKASPVIIRYDFDTYNQVQVGRQLILERLQNTNIRFKSFEDYNKYRKAWASIK